MHYFYIYNKISNALFSHLLTECPRVKRDREWVQREAYLFHFWGERAFTLARNITFGWHKLMKKQQCITFHRK